MPRHISASALLTGSDRKAVPDEGQSSMKGIFMKLIAVEKNDRRFPKTTRQRREYLSKPRLYMSHRNESMVENLLNRRSRPTAVYRELLPEIFEKLGLPATTKARWSQKAGCGCGCSPGFIINTHGRWDAFAEIK